MAECPNIQENLANCTCSFACGNRGRCCDCIRNHREAGQLPGCYFPEEVEKTGDRSIARFIASQHS